MTDLKLTVLAETAKTVTLGWTPVPGCVGYALYRDGVRRSNSWDPAKSSWKTDKGAIRIVALGEQAAGVWPPVVEPPTPPSPRIDVYVDADLAKISAQVAATPAAVIGIRPGRVVGQLFLPSWARVQLTAADPADPPVFVGPADPFLYCIYSEGASTVGPFLRVEPTVSYGVGVRANVSDIDGGQVVGCAFKGGATSIYQGTQPGRSHRNWVCRWNTFEDTGTSIAGDPHNPKGDGLHDIYCGGGSGVTSGAFIADSRSVGHRNGTPFQGGGNLLDSTFARLYAERIRASAGMPPSSYAGVGLFDPGTKRILIDDCETVDCDGYGFKAIGGAQGVLRNSRAVACKLGLQYGLTSG